MLLLLLIVPIDMVFVVVDCSNCRCLLIVSIDVVVGRCCCLFRSMLLLLIVPIDVVVVVNCSD